MAVKADITHKMLPQPIVFREISKKDSPQEVRDMELTGKDKFEAMENWDEAVAEKENKLCCHDCRHFLYGCNDYIGQFHKTCSDFEWW